MEAVTLMNLDDRIRLEHARIYLSPDESKMGKALSIPRCLGKIPFNSLGQQKYVSHSVIQKPNIYH